MKISLPLKLGIFVVVFFAIIIAACLLRIPLKTQWHLSQFRSGDIKRCSAGIQGFLSLGEKGKRRLQELVNDELRMGDSKRSLTLLKAFDSTDEEGAEFLGTVLDGGPSAIDLFIECMVNIGNSNHILQTKPMHKAVELNCSNTIQLLSRHGIPLDQKKKYHVGFWDGFDKNGNPAGGKIIENFTPLEAAICYRKTNAAKALIESGADVNARPGGEKTPLQMASEAGMTPIMKLLIERGAKIDSKALFLAISNEHTEFAKFLINNGADVNSTNRFGQTVLHKASLRGMDKIIRLLINKGADINARNRWNNNALFYATRGGEKNTVVYLISKGAEINTDAKISALHDAVLNKYTEIAEILIKHGADINALAFYNPNKGTYYKEGKTPLDLALEKKHEDCVILLRAHGGKTGRELRKEAGKK
ncbi:MAG: ankyrin repeat domain-containing protein [Planctomycetota bacterium]|nr:MAG: ankyrin repeat domain-containing protein [Planctomycetota bacterium]